jgi:hypothetical protein
MITTLSVLRLAGDSTAPALMFSSKSPLPKKEQMCYNIPVVDPLPWILKLSCTLPIEYESSHRDRVLPFQAGSVLHPGALTLLYTLFIYEHFHLFAVVLPKHKRMNKFLVILS